MAKIAGSQIRDNTITGADVDEASLRFPIDVVTSSLTLDSDHHTVLVASEGTVTVTLPTGSAYTGKVYTIKRLDEGQVDIASTEPIEGEDDDWALESWGQSVTIQYDGGKWWIIGHVQHEHGDP